MDRPDHTPPSSLPADEPFGEQLSLARAHAALMPMRRERDGYAVSMPSAEGWHSLRRPSGFAGFGLGRALRILLDVLTALEALHRTRGLDGETFVHGELVPELLWVGPDGVTRLVPLAPWHWSGAEAPAAHLGHLAPERLLGDALDSRADIFSAGTLLWEALAGRRLFAGESAEQIVMRLLGSKLALPELPPELAWAEPLKLIALRALSVDPAQRFPNSAALKRAIEFAALGHVASHAQVSAFFCAPALPVLPPPQLTPRKSSLSALITPIEVDEPEAETRIHRVAAPPRRRTRRAVWSGVVTAAVLAACAVLLPTRQDQQRVHAWLSRVASLRTQVARQAASPAPPPARAVAAGPSSVAAPSSLPAVSELPGPPKVDSPPVTPEEPVAGEATPRAPGKLGKVARPAKPVRAPKPRVRPSAPKTAAPDEPQPHPAKKSDADADQYGI